MNENSKEIGRALVVLDSDEWHCLALEHYHVSDKFITHVHIHLHSV